MSVGKGNWQVNQALDNTTLGRSYNARYLGVQVSSDLCPKEQCFIARNRANKILGFIGRCVTNRTSEVILRLYLALVRPHLDYAVQFWSPYYRKDIDSLEAVQRRMTKMIQGLRNLPDKYKLNCLHFHSLERRRARGNIIEVYK